MIPCIKLSIPHDVDKNDETNELNQGENSEAENTKPITYFGILSDSTVQLWWVSLIIAYSSMTFFEPVLTFRILEFTDSVQVQSLMVVFLAGGYAFMNICISYVARVIEPIVLVALGMFLAGCCNFMIGPSDFLPQSLMIIAIGFVLLGAILVFCTIL